MQDMVRGQKEASVAQAECMTGCQPEMESEVSQADRAGHGEEVDLVQRPLGDLRGFWSCGVSW